MQLINTEGMSFIGPGSEWFWTALSGLILAVTFIAIWRQLRLQSNAAAIEQAAAFRREWTSEPFQRARLATLLAVQSGEVKYNDHAFALLANWFETVGFLVRAGHLDGRVLFETFGDATLWWHFLGPTVRSGRVEAEDPILYEHFEYLVGVMAKISRAHGIAPLDEALSMRLLPDYITTNREAVALAEELRAVIVRPMSPAEIEPATPAVVA